MIDDRYKSKCPHCGEMRLTGRSFSSHVAQCTKNPKSWRQIGRKLQHALSITEGMWKLPRVNRVEVIDDNGRSYVSSVYAKNVRYSVQDGGRTLKIFIGGDDE